MQIRTSFFFFSSAVTEKYYITNLQQIIGIFKYFDRA